MLCFIVYTNIDNHGDRWGTTVQALAKWRHLVALHEATDALHWHWAISIMPYWPGGMVNKIILNLAKFCYILDYKLINYSFDFKI